MPFSGSKFTKQEEAITSSSHIRLIRSNVVNCDPALIFRNEMRFRFGSDFSQICQRTSLDLTNIAPFPCTAVDYQLFLVKDLSGL